MPVAGDYRELRSRITADSDRSWAELVRVLPMSARGQEPDPQRPPLEFEGVLRVGERDEVNLAGGKAGAWQAKVSAGRGELRIDRFRYPDLVIRSGDKLVAITRQGEPMFQVMDVNDRGETRLIVQLGDA